MSARLGSAILLAPAVYAMTSTSGSDVKQNSGERQMLTRSGAATPVVAMEPRVATPAHTPTHTTITNKSSCPSPTPMTAYLTTTVSFLSGCLKLTHREKNVLCPTDL